MSITTGSFFLIQSCNSSIGTAGPAGASDKTAGQVNSSLDECADISLQLRKFL